MLLTTAAAQYRRIRIRSAKELVLFIIAVLALYALQTFFEDKLGWSTKKARGVAGAILFVLVIVIIIISVAAES
ncbi:MAG: hypothetical protein IKG82_09860 [Oscillospiraceae bacterium]|nr:hypothetical protein [Oscillospiraceae bacterium]